MPGLYIADSTTARLVINPEGEMSSEIVSSRLAFKDKYIKNLRLDLDNSAGSLNGKIKGSECRVGELSLKQSSVILFAENDHVGAMASFDNSTEARNQGEVLVTGELARNDSGNLTLSGENLLSNLYFNDHAWRISPSTIFWEAGKGVQINSLRIDNADQSIMVDGKYSKTGQDTLLLEISRFDIGSLADIFKPEMGIEGVVSGKMLLRNAADKRHDILVNVSSDSTRIAGQEVGTVRVGSNWDDETGKVSFAMTNNFNSVQNIHISGSYSPGDRFISAESSFNDFNLACLSPLLSGLADGLTGDLNGQININGDISNPDIESKDARLSDTFFTLGYTDVKYFFNGPFHLDREGLHFDEIAMGDMFDGSGTVGGGILFNNGFQDLTLDTKIRANKLRVLNTEYQEGATYYGTIDADGLVSISGKPGDILIDINATTSNKSDLHISLSGSNKKLQESILVFKEPERFVWVDPYEQMMKTYTESKSKKSNMTFKLNVNVTESLETSLEFAGADGNSISGQGNGLIKLDVQPSRNIFAINGEYTLKSGEVRLSAMGIANKNFSIQDGSNIRFNGDVLESEMDIDAQYSTKVSLATLVSDSTSVSAGRMVNCGIHVFDKLKSPQFDFSIDIPDLDPTIKSRVDNALNTEDKVQRQVIALLVTNSFIPDEQSGIFNNTSNMIFSNMANIMSRQLNNVLDRLEIPVDLGLSYQNVNGGTNIFDVAISTQLFNNRVAVNGAIGNRKDNSSNDVIGDLDIEVKLDKAGALRMTLFSHSADDYTKYLDRAQRNGLGIAYQKEYKTFKELWKTLFRKKKDEAIEPEKKKTIIIE